MTNTSSLLNPSPIPPLPNSGMTQAIMCLYTWKVSIVPRTAKISWFGAWKGHEISDTSETSRPVAGSTKPPVRWVPDALSLAVKRTGCEVQQSRASIAEGRRRWSCTSTPLMSPWRTQGPLSVISGLRFDVDEICTLLGY
jgi:hypothetical protein